MKICRATALALALTIPLGTAAAHGGTLTTLYNVPEVVDGEQPYAPIKVGHIYYGTTEAGGQFNKGTIYRYDPGSGKEQVIYNFTGGADGGTPSSGLVLLNGTLYGATSTGGANTAGTVFTIDPDSGTETTIYSPNNLSIGGPLLAANGLLYGTSENYVVGFDPSTDSQQTTFQFPIDGTGIHAPVSALLFRDNALYGTSATGGSYNGGTLFRIDLARNTARVLYSFAYSPYHGSAGAGPLTVVRDVLYGTTEYGGADNLGMLFAYDLRDNSFTDLHDFSGGTEGSQPGTLTFAGGLLYGPTTAATPSGDASLFSFDPASRTLTTVFTFNGAYEAYASIVAEPGGPLVGIVGPEYDEQNLFSFDPSTGVENTLHIFTGFNGSSASALTQVGGLFYGVSSNAGDYSNGSIYKVDPGTGVGKTIYSFSADGSSRLPSGPLLDLNGVLYGVTTSPGDGTAYKFTPASRTMTTLYHFDGGTDGAQPSGQLAVVGSLIYGTTSLGGTNNAGTVFSVAPLTGSESVVHSFNYGVEGGYPSAGFTVVNGALFGPVYTPSPSFGSIVKTDPSTGATTTLFNFTGGRGGGFPETALTAGNGLLYGTTSGGHIAHVSNSRSVVFSLDPNTGTKTILGQFDRFRAPAEQPLPLVVLCDHLYGTTEGDREPSNSIFAVKIAGPPVARHKYFFSGARPGSLLAYKGHLYGTTSAAAGSSDPSSVGTVFRFDRNGPGGNGGGCHH